MCNGFLYSDDLMFSGAGVQKKVLLLSFLFVLLACGKAVAQVPVGEWQIAGPYPADRVNREAYPNFYSIFLAPWQAVTAEVGGAVDLASHLPRENAGGDLAIARHVFWAPQDTVLNLSLAYAGQVDLFFNGYKLFSGEGEDRLGGAGGGAEGSRPQGPPDRFPLYVKAGLNEIYLMASSGETGWGYRAETVDALAPRERDHGKTREIWSTEAVFLTSESVLKDPNRDILYVTSFDNEYSQKPEPSGFISTMTPQGEILELKWVEGLHAPTGMDIWRDTLFVCEREHLLAIDLATGEVAGRWAIPDPVFPNDLVIDGEGTIYVSDTRTGDWDDSRIYRFRDGRFDIFANEGISRANGLWIHDGWLIVGSSGDGYLKKVELATGRVERIISLGWGVIDGIRVDRNGDYLVSHWEGQLYRISPDGRILEVLDAMPMGWNTADFEYLPEEGILLIPTFLDNRVRALRIDP